MVKYISKYNNNPRICFVAHFAYGALAGGNCGHVGGVERQTSLMAKWFAERGYPVSMLTWDEGQEEGAEIDGVQVLKICRKDAGVKGLRFLWPKWTGLVDAMRRADADIYYQNNAECVTGQVALWCRDHGRRFIYSVASDTECQAELPRMHSFRDRLLYRYGLEVADTVIVQTRKQRRRMQNDFRRDSVVIPMPCPGPSDAEYEEYASNRHSPQSVLWIGRICRVKRPDRLLDLAASCPDLHFDLVGPADNTDYATGVCRRAKSIPNITLHGPVKRNLVCELYKKAGVLCCTSDVEGFPNTFLEAWSYGLPVVTTFDPDNLVSENGLGRVGDEISELATGLRSLLNDSKSWQNASRLGRQYYMRNHTVDESMQRFERVFTGAVDPAESDYAEQSEHLGMHKTYETVKS